MEKTIHDYIEGWYNKDPVQMDRSLHAQLVKRSLQEEGVNGIRDVSKTTLLPIVSEYGGQNGDSRRMDISVFDTGKNIATAKLVSNDFVDYLHLVRQDNEWKIINVLWEYISSGIEEMNEEIIRDLEKPVKEYVEGWYDKDADHMAAGLHPNLAKRSLNPENTDGIDILTKQSLLEIVPLYGGTDNRERKMEIEILDVRKKMASVKVTSNAFIDYLHLCNWQNRWWILNVLWAFR